MDDGSAVKLIRNLKLMAEDKNKRPALAGDSTCVGGLVMVLSNQNKYVIQKALETLILLSECTDQVPFLASFVGMQDQIQAIIDRPNSDVKCKQLATVLMENLYMKSQPADKENGITIDNRKVPRNFFLSGQLRESKTIILQIKGMINQSDMNECRQQLIRVKGLVSVTFDLKSKRAIARARTSLHPQTLAEAVAKTGTMSAEQVVRGDDGEQMLISFGAGNESKSDDSVIEELPEYLPDEISPVRVGSKPMARLGSVPQSDNWWNKAANFISSSLYW